MDRVNRMSAQRNDVAESARICGRALMSRRGNVTKLILAFMFCITCAVLCMFTLDAISVYFLPDRLKDGAAVLNLALTVAVYSVADLWLLRLGVRAGQGRIELFDLGNRGNGSGFSSSVAAVLGVVAEIAIAAILHAYLEIFSPYVSRVLGQAVNGLCTLLTSFLVGVAFFHISTGLFFLGAVSEREKRGPFSLIALSFRAARGNRAKIVKFVLSFALLTFLSLFSLGVFFFVYVLPLYILSYGAFTSEVLDYKEC